MKKRHNSEGKVKNKDKNRDKVKRKSVVTEPKKQEETVSPPTPPQPAGEMETKLNALDKGRAAERRPSPADLTNSIFIMTPQQLPQRHSRIEL